MMMGELKAALQDCNEALQIKPNDPRTLDRRGLAYLRMGQIKDAIADYEAALKLERKMPGALYGRGVAKLMSGETAASNASIEAAKTLKPTIAEEFARYGVRAEPRNAN
jgi:Flp pilus assembly protein TadD